jgi:subtilisin family serine protease
MTSLFEGVLVYILDTGVKLDHQELVGRAFLGASFNGEKGDTDGNGHGTHVAGTKK